MDVRELYERLIEAWNARDAAAFAALFADDGVCIGFDGSEMVGREIAEELGRIFEDHPTASYVTKVREVRDLGFGVTVLRSIVGMVPPGKAKLNAEVNAHQTLLVADRRIVLLQNTPAQYHDRPDLVKAHTAEIEAVRAAT